MSKNLIVALLFLVNSFAFAHCPMDFKEVKLCADITWTNGPAYNQNSAFTLKFWVNGDHNHAGVAPAYDINIYSWMIMDNGHNHGGPKMTWVTATEGLYEVYDAKFIGGMKGFWEIHVDLKDASGAVVSSAAKKVVIPEAGAPVVGGESEHAHMH